MPYQEFINERELSHMLGVTLSCVRFWRKAHRSGPDYFRLTSGNVRYSKRVVAAWLASCRVKGDWPKRLHKRDAIKAAA